MAEDNKDLKEAIDVAILNFTADTEKKADFTTSIREGTYYAELYLDGQLIFGTSEQLPDGEFNDVEVERTLILEFMAMLVYMALNNFKLENE